MPEFSGATIQKAFAALEKYLLVVDGQAPPVFGEEQQTMLPPASESSKEYIQPLSLSPIERMHLEAALLNHPSQDLREDAADSLVGIAESVDCTIPTARRILDILESGNNSSGGEFSSQMRKAKKVLERLVGHSCFSDSNDDAKFEKRDTLPFPGKQVALGTPRQGPQPAVVDTTEKIQKSKAKK